MKDSILKTPRQVKSQQVKDKMLDAAMALLKNHGYEYITISNICKLAGVSVGSFYHHFTNKDDLLGYYLVVGYEKNRERFTQIHTADVIENIRQIYHFYIEFCLEQGLPFLKRYYTPLNKGLNTRSQVPSERVSNLPIQHQTVVAIRDARDAGYIREDVSPDELGEELCTLEKGCIFDWCLSDGAFDLLDLSHKMIRNYLHGALTERYFKKFRPAKKRPSVAQR